jgi:hypothetical protein
MTAYAFKYFYPQNIILNESSLNESSLSDNTRPLSNACRLLLIVATEGLAVSDDNRIICWHLVEGMHNPSYGFSYPRSTGNHTANLYAYKGKGRHNRAQYLIKYAIRKQIPIRFMNQDDWPSYYRVWNDSLSKSVAMTDYLLDAVKEGQRGLIRL